MQISSMLASLLGVIAGGIITWGAAWWYYKEAGKQLKKVADRLDEVAKRLQAYLTVLIVADERAGLVKATRDAKGEVTGFIEPLQGTVRGGSGRSFGSLATTEAVSNERRHESTTSSEVPMPSQYPLEGKAYFQSAEFPPAGDAVCIALVFQDDSLQPLGVGNITLMARKDVTLHQLDELAGMMRKLLSGRVLIQQP